MTTMFHRLMLSTAALALSAGFPGCEVPSGRDDVGTPPACGAVRLSLFLPPVITSPPVSIRGTISSDDNDAIEGVIVAGRVAKSDSFNYRTFVVTLERSDLEALPRAAKTNPQAAAPTAEAGAGGAGGAEGSAGAANQNGTAGAQPKTHDEAFVPVSFRLTRGQGCQLPEQQFKVQLALLAADSASGGSSARGGANALGGAAPSAGTAGTSSGGALDVTSGGGRSGGAAGGAGDAGGL